jgi:hypothetical protein
VSENQWIGNFDSIEASESNCENVSCDM